MNHRINKNEKTTITFIIGDKLRVINNVQQAIETLVRRNDPDIKYNIKNMEIDFNDESARVAVETPDNEMTLFYNITKSDKLMYLIVISLRILRLGVITSLMLVH